MPYVGNSPASNFASVTKDTFSGDGSTTAFTLSKAATTNGVAVFVENVRQEPTTAYAVSGTTLTFTAAPVSASGNNIYVLHHNAPASTATHPAGQDLTAANTTLTGDVTIGSGTAADRKILFDGNAQDYHIGLDDSSDSLIIGKGSALGTTSHIVTDASGRVTKPLTPYFFGGRNSGQTGSGSDFVSTVVTTNRGSHYNTSNGRFTAPVAGDYFCSFKSFSSPQDLTSAHYAVEIRVNGSTKSQFYFYHSDKHFPIAFSEVINLSASDYVTHYIAGSLTVYGTDQTYATQSFYLLG
jgi:hypothetical protein